jgi:acyl-CoA synthetase (AMP-forming)/AMP-acid ligase II
MVHTCCAVTSGTTGLPKAAGLSHLTVVNNGRLTARGASFTEADKVGLPAGFRTHRTLVLSIRYCVVQNQHKMPLQQYAIPPLTCHSLQLRVPVHFYHCLPPLTCRCSCAFLFTFTIASHR